MIYTDISWTINKLIGDFNFYLKKKTVATLILLWNSLPRHGT